ncbi:unnamed protein product [Cuscuta campestris]|uniref:Uncharacterized protein n=1 Tax=Cuscuta campestris TaxID=132261 RepID=A0A484LXM3_9ASTE|nr:unnamed protein product [Cuscuta campestris]
MRGRHEEIERLERSIVKELQMEPAAAGGLHRVRAMIKRIMEVTNKLVAAYEDSDGSMKYEIEALGAG